MGNLGSAYLQLGDARQAIGYYKQALEISREIGDRRAEGNHLGNLGVAWRNLSDAQRAIGYHQQYFEISREIGDRRGEGNALGNLVLFHTTDLDFCGARKPEKSLQMTTETARKHSGCSRARWAKARLCFVKGH